MAYAPQCFQFEDTAIRFVEERDIDAVAQLFRLNYGDAYPYSDVYNGIWVKRAIYSDNILCVVVEEDGGVVGTGAVLLDCGDYDDQLGELARLVVHPEHNRHGIGHRIINALFATAQDHVEFAFAEARTAHLFSQKTIELTDFAAIGFYPRRHILDGRCENLVLYGKLHGHAHVLRSENCPQLIPAVAELAGLVLASMGLPSEVDLVDGKPYPTENLLSLSAMDRDANEDLERLQRRWVHERIAKGHQLEKRMLFGPVSLSQGLPFTKRHGASYLMSLDDRAAANGAIGFLHNQVSQIIRGIELLGQNENVRGGLCAALARIAAELRARIVEVDVSAYDARLQATFYELGFRPIAYAPAMVFDEWERLDVVKMIKLNVPYEPGEMKLTERSKAMVSLVETGFIRRV